MQRVRQLSLVIPTSAKTTNEHRYVSPPDLRKISLRYSKPYTENINVLLHYDRRDFFFFLIDLFRSQYVLSIIRRNFFLYILTCNVVYINL